jgi:GxxExxY protein
LEWLGARRHDGATARRRDGTTARRHDGTRIMVMVYTVRTPLSDEEELVAGEVISAALTIHRDIGPGYPERFYQRAMIIELKRRALSFETEVRAEVHYEGVLLGTHRVDLVVQGLVIAELKSVEKLDTVHRKQLISYLKATKLRLGLLINFNTELLKQGLRRVIL